VPSAIDDQSGYRYYDKSKIEKARIITYLRTLDFALNEIADILRHEGDDSQLLEVMERQRAIIAGKMRQYRRVVRSLDQFIAEEREPRKTMTQASFEIQEKMVNPLLIAGVRMKGRYHD
jgi:DNA-binding transcriptional MerR regulator